MVSYKFNPFTGNLDIVSEEDLSGYVPYTGATANLDLGTNDISITGAGGRNLFKTISAYNNIVIGDVVGGTQYDNGFIFVGRAGIDASFPNGQKFSVYGGKGRSVTSGLSAIGGVGADVEDYAGQGGSASGGLISTNGGAGGKRINSGGAGGTATDNGTSRGGLGGDNQNIGGAGGTAFGTGTNIAGKGGNGVTQGADGGTAYDGSSNYGGDGGHGIVAGGIGGIGSTSDGFDGSVIFQTKGVNQWEIYGTDGSLNGDDNNLTTTGTGRFDGGLTDSTPTVAIDLVNRELEDSFGTVQVDWENCHLKVAGGQDVVDWCLQYLTDTSDKLSIYWTSRLLYANDGTDIILDWLTPGLADFKDTTIKTTSLSASLGVYTDATSQLTSTAPTSGVLGYWDRTGIILSQATKSDELKIIFDDPNTGVDTYGAINTWTFLPGAGDFKIAELELYNVIFGYGSVKNGLYVRGVDNDPLLLFSNSTVTAGANIRYDIADTEMLFEDASTYVFDDDVSIKGDDVKLAFGAAGTTDSYIQFGGTNLEFYSSGAMDFLASSIVTTTTGTFGSTNQVVLGGGTYGADVTIPNDGYAWYSHDASVGDFVILHDGTSNLAQFYDATYGTIRIGDGGNGVLLYVDGDSTLAGDTFWVGAGTGLPYASICAETMTWSADNAAQNTWYEIADSEIAPSDLNLFTEADGVLTALKTGKYLINYNITVSSSIVAKHIETGIEIDASGTPHNCGQAHFTSSVVDREFTLAGTAILALTANQTIQLSIRHTTTGTPDIDVHNLNMTAVMVGG